MLMHSKFVRLLTTLVICVLLLSSFIYYKSRPSYALYTQLAEEEINGSHTLLQKSRMNKFILFKQLQGAGFNNQAQEILLYHHLALQTSRVYVYQPLVWRPRGEKATVPLSAFLTGPTQDSIDISTFNEVCPESERVHLKLGTSSEFQWGHAVMTLHGNDRCIVVDDWIFNWNFLASPGLHEIWPTFQKYIANHFEWSQQVLDIVERAQSQLELRPTPTDSKGHSYMALHLRRGDFEDHCQSLSRSHTGFTTWATLPLLQSSVFPPALDQRNSTSVVEHCYPTLQRILATITHQAKQNPTVRRLHILHDGAWDHPTVYLQYHKLVAALTNSDWARRQGWPNGPMVQVTQSADVPIKWGESDWAVCVDVELANRAEVFIGNGYSSLTTQVVALRLGSDNGRAEDITFF